MKRRWDVYVVKHETEVGRLCSEANEYFTINMKRRWDGYVVKQESEVGRLCNET